MTNIKSTFEDTFYPPNVEVAGDRRSRMHQMLIELNLPVKDCYYGAIDANKPYSMDGPDSDNGAWFCELETGGQVVKIVLGLYDFQAEFNIRTIIRPLVLFFGLDALTQQMRATGFENY
jgi:hypothetical protein